MRTVGEPSITPAVQAAHAVSMRCTLFIATLCLGLVSHGQTGPGGVGNTANNVLWLRADNGVNLAGSNITNWSDRSGNNNNAAPPRRRRSAHAAGQTHQIRQGP